MRFYRPTIKQPISTFVEAPLDFMQSVMEKDQQQFNLNDASLQKQRGLLDDLVVHDIYKEEKDKRVGALQKQLEEASDELNATGDINRATRAIYNVQNEITKDRFLKEAPAYSKTIWETEEKMRENKKPLAAWNNFYNPYWEQYSKGWQNPDGSIKPFSPGKLYEDNLDIHKKQKEMLGNIASDKITQSGIEFDAQRGLIIDRNTGTEYIGGAKLRKIANQKSYDFVKTDEAIQGMRRNNMLYGEGKELSLEQHRQIFEDEMYRAGIEQLFTKETGNISAKEMSDGMYKKLGISNNDNPWNNFEAVQVTEGTENKRSAFDRKEQIGSAFMITPSQEELDKNPKMKADYEKFQKANNGGYNTFNELSEGDKKIAMAYFDTKGYKNSKQKFISDKMTQKELETFYKDIKVFERDFMNKGFKQNLVKRNVGSVKEMNKVYSGFEQEEVPLTKFKEAGNLTGSDQVWSFAENKMIPFSQINAGKEDVAQVNAEFGSTSPLFTLSGDKPEWASPKQLVITRSDGSVETYGIPDKGRSKGQMNVDAAIATVSKANYYPNVIVPSFDENYRIKFVPLPDSDMTPEQQQKNLQLSRQAGLPVAGTYAVYDKDGKMIASPEEGLANPELVTSFITQQERK